MPEVAVVVATGAFDCGKTTTLEWLRAHHGRRIHVEAHRLALRDIAPRSGGHPPERGFTRIDDPAHFCPMCRPESFAALVLDKQRAIEARACDGDLLERGYLDPIEMLERVTQGHAPRPRWDGVARYRLVLLFELMPELQRPRWGKSAATRVAEARAINRRLASLYVEAGFDVRRVEAGSVPARAAQVLAHLARA